MSSAIQKQYKEPLIGILRKDTILIYSTSGSMQWGDTVYLKTVQDFLSDNTKYSVTALLNKFPTVKCFQP